MSLVINPSANAFLSLSPSEGERVGVRGCGNSKTQLHTRTAKIFEEAFATGFPLPSTGRGIKGEGWERTNSALIRVAYAKFIRG